MRLDGYGRVQYAISAFSVDSPEDQKSMINLLSGE